MTYQEYKALVTEEVLNYYAECTGETIGKIKRLFETLEYFQEEVKAKVNDVMIEILSKDAPEKLLSQLNQLIAKH